ncbi:hypothetical protein [Shewanella sp. HN-41]|uniref:hypothetical protein n=1 Tax=Shewanella sp. HN-41 TaxID=327275 RepID=UPI00021266EB|nr:hypothetical protein [Shewanella sp. HN-41]EGM70833.1 hypothetical protein SOHN41_01197 [Shewanella sp. HN-41]
MATELTVGVIGAVATIIAALIGIIVAVTTAVISKEQKISEFRQDWINEMRKDVASLLTTYNDCLYHVKYGALNSLIDNSISFHTDEYLKSNLFKLIQHSSSIKFRLNPESDKALIRRINNIREIIVEISTSKNEQDITNAFTKGKSDIEKLESDFHKVLKSEWERVKRGEKHFVRFRSLGEICLFAFIAVFFVVLAFVKIPELAILLS